MQKNVCTKTRKIRPFFLEFSSAILLRSSFSRLCWPYFAWLLDTSELIHWLAFVWYYKNNLTCGISARDNFYHFIWWRIVYFWLSFRLSDASSADQSRKTCGSSRRNLFRSMIQVQLISPAIATTQSCKVHKIGNLQANIVPRYCWTVNVFKGCSKTCKKIRVHRCFPFDSVSNIFTNLLNFPAKRLTKNTAPKIRMRQFF